MARRPPFLDTRVLTALAHPLRFELLVALGDRVASPKELAAELGEPIGRVSHHIRTLAGIGAIELVRTEPRRGAVEHFYRAAMRAWFNDEQWAAIPAVARRSVFASLLERISHDVSAAASGQGFDHPQAHVSFTLLELDRQGVDAVAAILEETLERVLEVNSDCAARKGEGRMRAELAMLLFEPPPAP